MASPSAERAEPQPPPLQRLPIRSTGIPGNMETATTIVEMVIKLMRTVAKITAMFPNTTVTITQNHSDSPEA